MCALYKSQFKCVITNLVLENEESVSTNAQEWMPCLDSGAERVSLGEHLGFQLWFPEVSNQSVIDSHISPHMCC